MLTAQQLEGIQHLQHQCEQHDRIELKLNWDMLRDRKEESLDFFVWKEDILIAYLALYGFGSSVEVCGMVMPSERRNGHFTNLWMQAQQAIIEKGFTKVLFNAPGTSQSAKKWMDGQSCNYSFSEFHMQWQPKELADSKDIKLREATLEDKTFETELDAEAFFLSSEDAEAYYEQRLSSERERRYIIEIDGNAIGKIRVTRNPDESYLSGFAMLLGYRGKGYGGQALQWIVKQEQSTGNRILLDVETKNDNALKLYERIGFVQQERQDYYDVPIALLTK